MTASELIRKYKISKLGLGEKSLNKDLIELLDYFYTLFDMDNIKIYKLKTYSGLYYVNMRLNKIVCCTDIKSTECCYISSFEYNFAKLEEDFYSEIIAVMCDIFPDINPESMYFNYPFNILDLKFNDDNPDIEYTKTWNT